MLEQMYLITVPKISVLGPNCWETTTEFSRHKNRIWTSAVDVLRKLGPCHSEIRLIHVTLRTLYLVQLFL
jgi:hypothetical protein